jgi:ATP-dependent DNA helicase RecQ
LAAVRQVYQHLADFLQVPKGSGQGLYYDFDLLQFVQTFKLEPRLVTNALKVLEQEGFISYNEQVFLPARIHFTAGKTVLDDLDQTYPQLAETARTLLRSYGGILEQAISVSEWMVAKARRLPKDLVVQQLQQLHTAGIIAYLPRKDTPQLYFVTNRAAAGELHINEQRYFERKKAYTGKVQQMLQYLDLTGCREAFIGRYFGDETLVACGSCDNCIRHKRQPLTVAAFRAIANELLELLAGGEYTLAQVQQHFHTTSKVHIKEVLFYLQSERTIRIAEDRISRL